MFKINKKSLLVAGVLALLAQGAVLNAIPMSSEQQELCDAIGSATGTARQEAYKNFVESLSDAVTGAKVPYHNNKKAKHENDLNSASAACLTNFCNSINESDSSVDIQDALTTAYQTEIEPCNQ